MELKVLLCLQTQSYSQSQAHFTLYFADWHEGY